MQSPLSALVAVLTACLHRLPCLVGIYLDFQTELSTYNYLCSLTHIEAHWLGVCHVPTSLAMIL